jgi:hypothetical protein
VCNDSVTLEMYLEGENTRGAVEAAFLFSPL